MAACPQHDFIVLTKRAEEMHAYMSDWLTPVRLAEETRAGLVGQDSDGTSRQIASTAPMFVDSQDQERLTNWPLPNVWLGVSVEDQRRADGRIPILLNTPAAIRCISAEPLIGKVDLLAVRGPNGVINALTGNVWDGEAFHLGNRLDWVIAGGESGPRCRPMHPLWPRFLLEQCRSHDTPFFFKQWGDWTTGPTPPSDEARRIAEAAGLGQMVNNTWMVRSRKGKTGREMDGRTWDGFPQPVSAAVRDGAPPFPASAAANQPAALD
jgi:protein gp37